MRKSFPTTFVNYLLPFLTAAGNYAVQIQSKTRPHRAKAGDSPFQQALSDADLTIQSYLEVVLLSQFPELSYFSEEQEQSLNAKYFPKNAQFEVLLDPIDGTRSYLDNRRSFQLIVTLHDKNNIVAAICHAPRLGKCFYAIRGNGAYVVPTDPQGKKVKPKRIRVKESRGPIVGSDIPLFKKLATVYPSIDWHSGYTLSDMPPTFVDIIESKVAACVSSPSQLIDGGAIAFIAQEAGAIVTDFKGRPLKNFRKSPDRKLPEVLVAGTRKIHSLIVKTLNT